MIRRIPNASLLLLCLACIAVAGTAFAPLSNHQKLHLEAVPLQGTSQSESGLKKPCWEMIVSTSAAVITANVPLLVQAVEDDYEYGAVNAPIGIAWVVGVLAILTALLPVFLRSGEEAFEEIRNRDEGTFGKSNNDVLKRKK